VLAPPAITGEFSGKLPIFLNSVPPGTTPNASLDIVNIKLATRVSVTALARGRAQQDFFALVAARKNRSSAILYTRDPLIPLLDDIDFAVFASLAMLQLELLQSAFKNLAGTSNSLWREPIWHLPNLACCLDR
jgi:hypothetical protein